MQYIDIINIDDYNSCYVIIDNQHKELYTNLKDFIVTYLDLNLLLKDIGDKYNGFKKNIFVLNFEEKINTIISYYENYKIIKEKGIKYFFFKKNVVFFGDYLEPLWLDVQNINTKRIEYQMIRNSDLKPDSFFIHNDTLFSVYHEAVSFTDLSLQERKEEQEMIKTKAIAEKLYKTAFLKIATDSKDFLFLFLRKKFFEEYNNLSNNEKTVVINKLLDVKRVNPNNIAFDGLRDAIKNYRNIGLLNFCSYITFNE